MALQSIKRSTHGHLRHSSAPQSVQAGSYVSRISPADELQLACRLAECRRELLAIALLDTETSAELQRVATELASGARRIGDLVESDATAAEAELEFRLLREQALALQREAALVLRASHDHSAFGALELDGLESLSRRMLELVKSLPPTCDLTDRMLQASWTVRRPSNGDAGLDLPRSLRAKVRRLEVEIETIRSRFIHANQGLVAYVVQRYRGMGLRRDDLMQEGNIGLLRAIEKFDHRRGTRFSVYAVWWIRQAVRRALANQSRTIRIPVHALAVRYAVDQASKRLALELGREPSEQELASATGVVPNGVAQVLGMVKEPLSLDAPRGPDSEASLGESVADRAALSPNEHAARNERADRLHGLLDALSAREREMLRMRFGLDGADECTLEQIGQMFALTRERVRQIVTAALDKLHHQTQIRRLELEPTPD
ncbi:MAG TPA: sigma-70 family RNA polymerase sigma factor [Polyangiaceae bacterium]|nr:sigma-70 family RNA polymerase sigma factor [Polyangiaceae bacterium]